MNVILTARHRRPLTRLEVLTADRLTLRLAPTDDPMLCPGRHCAADAVHVGTRPSELLRLHHNFQA